MTASLCDYPATWNGSACIAGSAYDATDTGNIVVDVLGKILVAIGTLATIIGLILAYKFIKTGKAW